MSIDFLPVSMSTLRTSGENLHTSRSLRESASNEAPYGQTGTLQDRKIVKLCMASQEMLTKLMSHVHESIESLCIIK